MSIGRIIFDDSFFVVTGVLDEHVDYEGLASAPGPLKLNLGAVLNVNSLGVRNFLRFVRAHMHKGLELHECSIAFMDAINTIPGMLGQPQRPEILKSVRMLYQCIGCGKEEASSFSLPVLKGGGRIPDVPARICGRCGRVTQPAVEAEDLFTFLMAGD